MEKKHKMALRKILLITVFFVTYSSELLATTIDYNYNFSGRIDNVRGSLFSQTPDNNEDWGLLLEIEEGDIFTGYINATFTYSHYDPDWGRDLYSGIGDFGITFYNGDKTYTTTYDFNYFMYYLPLGHLYNEGSYFIHQLIVTPETNSGSMFHQFSVAEAGQQYYDYGYSIQGSIETVTPVAEPTTFLLFATGMAGLSTYRLRKKLLFNQ